LKEDPDHLENHEYYFEKEDREGSQASEHPTYERQDLNKTAADSEEDEFSAEKKDSNQHLDIYV